MDNFVFYVVSPAVLQFPYSDLTLQERWNRLRDLLKKHAAQWELLRGQGVSLMESVQAMAGMLNEVELPDLTYENSPDEMLPLGSIREYDPMFGYFDPPTVRRLNHVLQNLPESEVVKFEQSDEEGLLASVLHTFRSTFAEAASRGVAVAIDHN